jgi:modulator of FtsH protease HflK
MLDRLVDLLIACARWFQFCVVVRDYEGGVCLRWGRYHRLLGPGFHWLWPFHIEESLLCAVVLETKITQPQSLTTKDGVSMVISTVVTFTVSDPRTFLLGVFDAQNVIEDSTVGTVSRSVEDSDWDEIRADGWAEKLTITVRRRAKRYGIDVQNVQPADLTRSRSIRLIQQTLNPMVR